MAKNVLSSPLNLSFNYKEYQKKIEKSLKSKISNFYLQKNIFSEFDESLKMKLRQVPRPTKKEKRRKRDGMREQEKGITTKIQQLSSLLFKTLKKKFL